MGFDLKQQLVFYGAYHRDPTNVTIHMICVPILLATGFLFGTNTPALPAPAPLAPFLDQYNLPLNFGTLAAVLYSVLYIKLSPNFAGVALTPLIMASVSWMNKLMTQYPSFDVNSIAIGIHIISWVAQFIGHGKYEGRKPALLDNLVQALFLAPLFVWYEALFGLGFYRGLKKDVDEMIEVEVKKINGKGQ